MPPIARRAALLGLALALPAAAFAEAPRAAYADAGRCGGGSAFIVENQADAPVTEIFLRVTGAVAWGEDRLGERILAKGQTQEFDPGPQIVDVLMLRADGRAFLAARQDACRISAIRLNADGTLGLR